MIDGFIHLDKFIQVIHLYGASNIQMGDILYLPSKIGGQCSNTSITVHALSFLWEIKLFQCIQLLHMTRRFKRTLKKQNRRRKWNPLRRPLLHQHPASFLSHHWRLLKSTYKILQVRVHYYIIFPKHNHIIYQQSYLWMFCPRTAISFKCCHCGIKLKFPLQDQTFLPCASFTICH